MLFMAVICLASYFYIAPQVDRKTMLEKSRDVLETEIQLKKTEIRKLVDMQQDFSSDHEFVEYIGHQNKQVWPNEVVFVFDSE
jgi:hypothetical protein